MGAVGLQRNVLCYDIWNPKIMLYEILKSDIFWHLFLRTLRHFFKYLYENPWRFLHSNTASFCINKDIIWGDLCYEQVLDPFSLDEKCCVMLFSLLLSKKWWPFNINFSLSIVCYLKSCFERVSAVAPSLFIYSFSLKGKTR